MNSELTNKEKTSPEVNIKSAGSLGNYLRFILPSLLGIVIFITPIPYEDKTTILFSIVLDIISKNLASVLPYLLVVVTVLSGVMSLYYSLQKKTGACFPELIESNFVTTPIWVGLRVLGAIFTCLVVWKTGPAFIIGGSTGGTMVGFLAPNLLVLFFLATLTLPLLTDYGFMEFFGSLVRKVFKKLFKLPGRSAIDGLASWLGAAVIGVMLTVQQYNKGIYTQREAATVATTFSIVSLPFCLVIAGVIGLEHVFWSYYGSVVFIGIVCALIMPRIPPLSLLSDEYKEGVGKSVDEDKSLPGENSFQRGVRLGLERGQTGPGVIEFVQVGLRNLVGIWFGLLPATIAIGMIALILVEFTPIFQFISMPIVYVLDLLNISESVKAAPALIVGFADMYLPALIGKGIENEQTRFLIAILSVSQLIYMSEIGVFLIRAKIGLNISHLLAIFCIRTVIAAPIAILLAKYVIFA